MSARPRSVAAALAALAVAVGLAVIPALPASADVVECASLGGTWDDPTTTCTISTAQSVAGSDLTGNLVIAAGGSLTKTGNTGDSVSGTITIAGTLTVAAGSLGGNTTVVGSGTLAVQSGTNYSGTVEVNGPTAQFTLGFAGAGGPVVVTDGTFTNGGTVSSSITNADTVINNGSVGGAVVSNGGTFTNVLGTLNASLTVNGGSFVNNANILAPVTVNGGSFSNNANFAQVTGVLTIAAGATAANGPGSLAAVSNAGTFTNNTGGTTGAVTNTGSGSLVNDGTITGGVTHPSTGTFTGTGTTTPRYAQTVVFSSTAPTNPPVGSTYTVTLATSVGTTPSLAAGPAGVCSIAGATVTFLGDGTCTVTAARAADGNFAIASGPQSIAIGATAGGGAATLPATGFETGSTLLVGFGILALGGLVLLMRRAKAVRS